MYINPNNSYLSDKPCRNGCNPCYRYNKYPNCCVTCRRRQFGIVEDRTCKCGNSVPSGANGNRKYCDACLEYRTGINRYRVSHPDKARVYQRDNDRYNQSGFTQAMYDECFSLQGGLCGLCSTPLENFNSTHIHADHEPESNPKKPRGILCRGCNVRWLGCLEKAERAGDCKITNPQLIAWQTSPPMSRSSFATELGWNQPDLEYNGRLVDGDI